MPDELINLLPPERQRTLARAYALRLTAITALLVTLLVCIAALLLLPTYVFLSKSVGAKETRLAGIESTLSSAEEKELSIQLSLLTDNAALLTTLAHASSASAIIRPVLALPRPGITLSGLSYAPEEAKKPRTLALSGRAATREALRSYQLALASVPFARAADLPVSAYAKDADIAFTITLTLAP